MKGVIPKHKQKIIKEKMKEFEKKFMSEYNGQHYWKDKVKDEYAGGKIRKFLECCLKEIAMM